MKKNIHTKEQIAFQQILKSLRLKAGLSQNKLAKIIGKPQSFVSKYEAGERRLDILELRELCNAMGQSLIELIKKLEKALHETQP